jgi:hypothetical protein
MAMTSPRKRSLSWHRFALITSVAEWALAWLTYEKTGWRVVEIALFIPLKIDGLIFPPTIVQNPYLVVLSFVIMFLVTYGQNALLYWIVILIGRRDGRRRSDN